jgi:hypothetical protein
MHACRLHLEPVDFDPHQRDVQPVRMGQSGQRSEDLRAHLWPHSSVADSDVCGGDVPRPHQWHLLTVYCRLLRNRCGLDSRLVLWRMSGGLLLYRRLHCQQRRGVWWRRVVLSRCLGIRSGSDLRVLQYRRHGDDTDGTGAVRGRQLLRGWCQDTVPCRPVQRLARKQFTGSVHELHSWLLLCRRVGVGYGGAVRQQHGVLSCGCWLAIDCAQWLLQQWRRLELDTDERDGVSDGIVLCWRRAAGLPSWTLRQWDDADAVVVQWRVLTGVLLSR